MAEASGFIKYKSRHVMRNALINARRTHHLPHSICQGERPLAGRTVVVCGAGPSLRYNGGALLEAQDKQIPIVTVNAGDSALRSLGVRPDVVIARESLDLSDQAQATEARSWVLDISSHPNQWSVVESRDDLRGYWYLPLYPRHMAISRMLGVRPIPSGSSALCAAVSHVIEWGARRIVLAGVDLAVAPDGAVYHGSAPRGALTARIEGDDMVLEGDEQDHERARRSGQKPQGGRIPYEHVPTSDWTGLLRAKSVFSNQRAWLETMAAPMRHGRAIDCVNASERGCGIMGWRSERLAEVLHHEHPQPRLRLPEGHRVGVEEVEETARRLVKDARTLQHQAEQLLSPVGPLLRMLPMHLQEIGSKPEPTLEGNGLIEALAAWQLAGAKVETDVERVELQARAWLQAAEDALGALTLGGGS